MKKYFLTAFSNAGKTLLDDTFEAYDDKHAKEIALKKLEEKNCLETSHRLISSDARLILFNR